MQAQPDICTGRGYPEKSGTNWEGRMLITTDRSVFILVVNVVVIKLMTNYLGVNLHHEDIWQLQIKTHLYGKSVVRWCHGCSNIIIIIIIVISIT